MKTTRIKPNKPTTKSDPREELARLGEGLPRWLYDLNQVFLTWLTGKPYKGQQPLFRSSKEYELVTAIASLFGGATASTIIWHSSPLLLPLLSISWLVTVGAARKILICIIHRCSHYQMFGSKYDPILAEILSTLIFVQGFDGYQRDHRQHHNLKTFCTFTGDPDAKFILAAGFHPGMKDCND